MSRSLKVVGLAALIWSYDIWSGTFMLAFQLAPMGL